ncbi:hypothetical protein TETLON1_000053 [Candidatus Hodgkinia cicadicola]|nr:hypothetical protein TETLON1_000053 [Candidatus Hodgkinia cicadicola]
MACTIKALALFIIKFYAIGFLTQRIRISILEPNRVLNIKLGNVVVRPAEADKLNSGIIKSASVIEYNQGWAKAVRSGNVVIGTIDLVAACAWVESVELEFCAKTNNAIVRLPADKTKTHWTNVSYFTKGNELEDYIPRARSLNEVALHKAFCFEDASVREAKITKDELFRILSSKRLCIKLEDEDVVIIEFETHEINRLLKEQSRYVPNAKIEQLDLQQNLEYNLRHKAKQYLQNPSLSRSLAEQFEELKQKLANEINLPRLIGAGNNAPKM